MHNFEIKTTLGLEPTAIGGACACTYITRGASATLNFNLQPKVYCSADIDQLTVLLKQDKQLYWFKMFKYLVPTADAEPVLGKTYYQLKEKQASGEMGFQSTAEAVLSPIAPAENKYFEETTEELSWRDTPYVLDSHFISNIGETWDYITIMLQPEETAEFKTTTPESGMSFEIAIRLNTDILTGTGNKDSIVIEPQAPIGVVDSLYSNLI